MDLDPKLLEARKALREQFPLYARHALTIRDKSGDLRPLFPLKKAQEVVLTEVNRQLKQRGMVRLIILKARQQGISTLISALGYWNLSQRKGGRALVMAHQADSSDALFTLVKRYHEACPEFLRPSTRYSSRKELVFDKLDSSYTVATAGGTGVGRGETITYLHCSELAFWPKNKARETYVGLRQAVADKPGSFVFLESTANGFGNVFHELVSASMKREVSPGIWEGDTDFSVCFIPWHFDPDYSLPAPADFEPTPEEEKLIADYGVSFDQLWWRRLKTAEVGVDQRQQEYPATAAEAFISSGRPVFDLVKIGSWLERAKALKPTKMGLSPLWQFEPDPRGELTVYREPDPKESYVIGADVAQGVRGGDYSVAQVLDSKKRLCATWRGHIVSDAFARVLAELGYKYNCAQLVVENNGHGVLTCHVLSRQLNYPFLWKTVKYDELTDQETVVVGFATTAKSRPLILDQLRSAVRSDEIDIPDADTLREMQTFVMQDSGKLEADEGFHDDCVMALAIATHAAQSMADAIPVTDDYYCEAL